MPSSPRSLRVPEAMEEEIAREGQFRGEQEWSKLVLSLVEEALRSSRVPGITWVQRRDGTRRPAVAFTGLEVWEIIATMKECEKEGVSLTEAYPELTREQLKTAVAYYRAYPDEIDQRLELEAYWTPERVAMEMPFTRPMTMDART
jgi:uncharacterized protein (DUF433 family)